MNEQDIIIKELREDFYECIGNGDMDGAMWAVQQLEVYDIYVEFM